jgi:long-subunit acyl-CoA synthetase (AMP-forming)
MLPSTARYLGSWNLRPAVPLYDSLGENAVEYIVNHAGVELVFIDVAKLPEFVKVTACSSSCLDQK